MQVVSSSAAGTEAIIVPPPFSLGGAAEVLPSFGVVTG